jgi:hypothetical protein
VTAALAPGIHEIEPVALTQVLEGYDGRMIVVDDDVAGVARDLREIDPSLALRYSERSGHFVVVQIIEEGDRRTEHLVTTAQECDQRIVARVRKITHESYDFVKELEADQQRAERERRDNSPVARMLDEHGDELVFALRRDLRVQNRVFVP